MPRDESVVLALIRLREAGEAAVLTEGTEAVPPAGYDLVDIALMADVKNHTVARCVVHAVQRDGQLHGAKI